VPGACFDCPNDVREVSRATKGSFLLKDTVAAFAHSRNERVRQREEWKAATGPESHEHEALSRKHVSANAQLGWRIALARITRFLSFLLGQSSPDSSNAQSLPFHLISLAMLRLVARAPNAPLWPRYRCRRGSERAHRHLTGIRSSAHVAHVGASGTTRSVDAFLLQSFVHLLFRASHSN
jgi:hypothetical protein